MIEVCGAVFGAEILKTSQEATAVVAQGLQWELAAHASREGHPQNLRLTQHQIKKASPVVCCDKPQSIGDLLSLALGISVYTFI